MNLIVLLTQIPTTESFPGSTIALIGTAISIIGNIILGYYQFKKDKKKVDTEAITQLLTKALEMNKQELDVVRLISNDLRLELTAEKKTSAELKIRVNILEQEKETLQDNFEKLKE